MTVVMGIEVWLHRNNVAFHIDLLRVERHQIWTCITPCGRLVGIGSKFSTDTKVSVQAVRTVLRYGAARLIRLVALRSTAVCNDIPRSRSLPVECWRVHRYIELQKRKEMDKVPFHQINTHIQISMPIHKNIWCSIERGGDGQVEETFGGVHG